MKVVPMLNEMGNVVRNQYTYYYEGCHILQSYDRWTVKIEGDGQIYMDNKSWDASKTTAKYRNKFLNMGTNEIHEKIRTGEIKIIDLNNGDV